MNLPELSIPLPPPGLSVEIPDMMHPLAVHFAVAIPFVLIVIELINLFTKKRAIGVMSFLLMLLLSAVLYAALLTGSTDAQAAKAALGDEAHAILQQHKEWGIYLFYASLGLVAVKILSVLWRRTVVRLFLLIVLFLFAAATLATAKKGGELVYRYGVNVVAKDSSVSKKPKSAPSQSEKPQQQKENSQPIVKDRQISSNESENVTQPKMNEKNSSVGPHDTSKKEEGMERHPGGTGEENVTLPR